MKPRIGAITISQSPRHDLLKPMIAMFPEHEIIEAGALDNLNISDLPDGTYAPYPLTTTLNNGDLVTLDRDFLAPLVQNALHKLEAQGVQISVLLCAGDFPKLIGNMPLVKPTDMVQDILRAMGISNLAVISPIAIQQPPIEKKWEDAGFQPSVWTMPSNITAEQQAIWINTQLTTHHQVACVVLDYVGYPTDSMVILQKQITKPVFDLGHLALSALSAFL